GQVDDADGQPDDAADECGRVQADPQDTGEDGADGGHDDVVERRPEVDDLPGPERIVGDHREVDEGEGDERTEVDERGDEFEAERHRQQAYGTDEDDVEHRGVRLRVDVAEGPPRQHAIASHHQQHAGYGRVRGQPRGDRGGEGSGQEESLEEVSAGEEADLRQRVVDDGELRVVREQLLSEVAG